MNLTIQELKDIQSAVIFDTQGTHGDARSVRLEALYEKLKATIKEREVCLVSRVSVWKGLDRLLQQSKREGAMNSIFCECFGLTQPNAATKREKEECFVFCLRVCGSDTI